MPLMTMMIATTVMQAFVGPSRSPWSSSADALGVLAFLLAAILRKADEEICTTSNMLFCLLSDRLRSC